MRDSDFILSITENEDTKYLRTRRYTDPLFIARRCSIAIADKDAGSLTQAAFPEAVVIGNSPEQLTARSAAIDFDRDLLSVKEHGNWFKLPLHAATAAADWCYERLGSIPPEARLHTFYLRAVAEWRKASLSAPCAAFAPGVGVTPTGA